MNQVGLRKGALSPPFDVLGARGGVGEGEGGERGVGTVEATKGGLLYAPRLPATKSIQQEHELHQSCKLTQVQQGHDKKSTRTGTDTGKLGTS